MTEEIGTYDIWTRLIAKKNTISKCSHGGGGGGRVNICFIVCFMSDHHIFAVCLRSDGRSLGVSIIT